MEDIIMLMGEIIICIVDHYVLKKLRLFTSKIFTYIYKPFKEIQKFLIDLIDCTVYTITYWLTLYTVYYLFILNF